MKSAVIQTGGKQYLVAEGDTIEVEKLAAEPGSQITIDDVRMLRTDEVVRVGTPRVEGAYVVGQVLQHKKGPKKIIFKMIRREGYRRKRGHRQWLTVIRIDQIKTP